MTIIHPTFLLIDGENLVMRYQDGIASGRKPLPGIQHEEDVLVWHPSLVGEFFGDLRRVTYYTSATGDDDYIAALHKRIRSFEYTCRDGTLRRSASLVARVFKKPRQSNKSRAVDINIVIDALSLAHNGGARIVKIYSGDSDFVPLIDELMRMGVEVHVSALSSGLSRKMEVAGDGFGLLDEKLFEAP